MRLRLALRFGDEKAVKQALQVIADLSAAESDRLHLIQIIGESKRRECIPTLLRMVENHERI